LSEPSEADALSDWVVGCEEVFDYAVVKRFLKTLQMNDRLVIATLL
jgi:hypothetical protein